MNDERNRLRKPLFSIIVAACVINSVLVAFLVFWHIDQKRDILNASREGAEAAARSAAMEVNKKVAQLAIAEELADDISNGTLTDEQIASRFNVEMVRNPDISSLSIAYVEEFVPESLVSESLKGKILKEKLDLFDQESYDQILRENIRANPPKEGYLYFVSRPKVELDSCTTSENFNICEFDTRYIADAPADAPNHVSSLWYTKPLMADEGVWSGAPYFGTATRIFWAGGFGARFYREDPETKERTVAGIVSADVTVDQIQGDVFDAINNNLRDFPTEASYAFMFAKDGTLIAHPNSDFLLRNATLKSEFCYSDEICIMSAKDVEDLPLVPNNGVIRLLENHVERLSGKESLVYFVPISNSDWWLAIVLDKEVIRTDDNEIQRFRLQQIGIAFSILGLLFFLLLLGFQSVSGSNPRLWAISASFAILVIAGIAFLWFLNITSELDSYGNDIVLTNDAIPSKVIFSCADKNKANECNAGKLSSVPTGIFVQSVEFSSANNVIVTGYIWQKYSSELKEIMPESPHEAPGFILPEADQPVIQLAFEETTGDSKLFGWYFSATLRQGFDYSEYPFDKEEVWIRLWHDKFGQGVVLTPDLNSYRTTNPAGTPGLEKQDFVIEGWDIERSFFSYRLNSYDTTFGLTGDSRQNFPELYFNIGMRRIFIDAFIANLIPIGVVAILLFAVLLTAGSHEDRETRFGFSTANVLAFNAALFFVVIVSHVGLRNNLAAQGIIYIETFYFVMYGAILAVSANSILVASPIESKLLQYGDNLIVKLLYWPVILGIILLVTLLSFS